VEAKDLEKFQEGCGNVFRVHMDSLKKKERVKKGAKKEEGVAIGSGVAKKKNKKKGGNATAAAVKDSAKVKRDA
jgi:hypothetical protein